MKKIGLVTLYDKNNYGNRLQNYATKIFFEKLGYKVETLSFEYRDKCLYENIGKLRRIIKNDQIYVMLKRVKLALRKGKKDASIREKRFVEFNEEFVPVKTYYAKHYLDFMAEDDLKMYDFFVVGSDQVWNPDWAATPDMFLTFAEKSKRIAFSVSMGVDCIMQEKKEYFSRMLSDMHYISVREQKAVGIIKDLINKDVDCFLDPTLLIERKEWDDLLKNIKFEIPDNYFVSYFLGEHPSELYWKGKKITGDEIIYLNNEEKSDYYNISPVEFLFILKNAKYIYTDSFHAVVFSILFRKQFGVFDRIQNGNSFGFSRIETLLKLFSLEACHIERDNQENMFWISEQHFDDIDNILTSERYRCIGIIQSVMNN